MKLRWILLLAVVFLVARQPVYAEEAAGDAATAEAPAEDQALNFTLRDVKNNVMYQEADWAAEKWRKAKEGKDLPMGTRVKTGFDSFVKLDFTSANVLIVVNPNSQMTVTKYLIPSDDPTKREAHVDVKYGGIKVKVTKDVERTDMRVATPNITASVTGSEGGFSSRPGFADRVSFASGACNVQSSQSGQTVAVGAGDTSQVSGSQVMTALQTARNDRQGNATPRGTTAAEIAVAAFMPEVSGLLPGEVNSEQGNPAFQRVIEGSSGTQGGRLEELIEFNTDVPPPLRQGPGKNNR